MHGVVGQTIQHRTQIVQLGLGGVEQNYFEFCAIQMADESLVEFPNGMIDKKLRTDADPDSPIVGGLPGRKVGGGEMQRRCLGSEEGGQLPHDVAVVSVVKGEIKGNPGDGFLGMIEGLSQTSQSVDSGLIVFAPCCYGGDGGRNSWKHQFREEKILGGRWL